MAQPSAFDALLAESRDLLRDRTCDALVLMLDGADEALTKLADKADDEEMGKRVLEARDAAARNREGIEAQFRSRYPAEFQKALNRARGGVQSVASFSLEDLELVAEDDLNETLKLNDMVARLRRHCEEELSALDQRAGVLLGDATLEADDNPLGAKVIFDAFKQSCRGADCTVEQRVVLLSLFQGEVMEAIQAGYQQVNDLLVANGILPKIRYGISKTEGKAPASGVAGAPEKDKPATAEPEQDLFATLAKMMNPNAGAAGSAPAPGMGVGGVPLVQGAALMGSLTQMQVGNLAALGDAAAELGPILAEAGNLQNVLHRLKATSVGAGMGQVDAMTLDIVAMLYDELFEDPKIPVALKSLIGRLQLPMLKVAIADKELFTRKSHPARQLLDTLGQIGMRLPAEFNDTSPTFARLEAFVQELVDGFQEKMEIFDKVRADLEAIVAEDDQRVAHAMEDTEKQLLQAESLAVGKAAAQEEIRQRVTIGTPPPRAVIAFLAQQWIKYMVIVHAREGKESAAWTESLDAIDKILWSVEPKPTQDERKALMRTIPALLKALRAGVTAAGIEEAAANAFFAELMALHTELMHAPPPPPPVKRTKEKSAAGPAAPPAKAPAPASAKAPAPAPGKAVNARFVDTSAEFMDFTEAVIVNNPFGAGQVAVSSEDLDFTAAPAEGAMGVEGATLPPPPPTPRPEPGGGGETVAGEGQQKPRPKPASTVRLPTGMVMGAWVEIVAEDGVTRHATKLHYVSPMKSHFLFVDRKGHKVYECSRTKLARRIKLGEVTMLDREPDVSLFDRILAGLFGKLKAPLPI